MAPCLYSLKEHSLALQRLRSYFKSKGLSLSLTPSYRRFSHVVLSKNPRGFKEETRQESCHRLGFLRSRFEEEDKSAEDFLGNTLGVSIYGEREGIRIGQREKLGCNIASISSSNKWLESLASLESVYLIVVLICISQMLSIVSCAY